MADEFHTGSSSENWWSSSQTGFNGQSSASSDVSSFGWPETGEKKSSSCEESASVSGNSIHFQDAQKAQAADSISSSSILMDSELQMPQLARPLPSNVDWSQALLRSSIRGESSFHAMVQEDLSLRVNYHDDTGNEHRLISSDIAMTCQALPSNRFSIAPTSYSTVLQGFTEPNAQSELSPYDAQSMNYSSSLNYHVNSNEFSSPWSKFPHYLKTSSPKQQHPNQLHFSNNTPFWNASAEPVNDVKPNFYPSSQNQSLAPIINEKSNCSNFVAKTFAEEVPDSGSILKKSSSEATYKRSRNETPSQLPAFKVRKEKLGDRITTLQQLVSPFGKTDTASVLMEAIEYIKFLHGQVSVLSAPYMKNAVNTQQQEKLKVLQYHEQSSDKSKEAEGSTHDLRSHGLCLVPVSIIIPVASEAATDFWTPTYGGTFR